MMRKTVTFMVVIVSIFLAVESDAQRGRRWQGGGGWGPGTQYSRMYDPGTVETISGEVVRGERIFTPRKGMRRGVNVLVQTDSEVILVHLGPSWFMENQDLRIETKDQIEVRGSRIMFDGEPTIIAAEVQKGDAILKLRDREGFPVWSGWRRGGR